MKTKGSGKGSHLAPAAPDCAAEGLLPTRCPQPEACGRPRQPALKWGWVSGPKTKEAIISRGQDTRWHKGTLTNEALRERSAEGQGLELQLCVDYG